MTKQIVIAAVLTLLPTASIAQVPALEVGSAEAYRYQINMQERLVKQQQLEHQMKMLWNEAKKLYKVKPQVMEMSTTSPIGPDFATGNTGCIDRWETEVQQVVDEKNAILRVDKSMLWLEDFDTSDLADGQKVRLLGFVKITGTKSYETVAGSSKTLFVVKFLNEQESAEFQKKIDEMKQQAAQAAEDAKYVTWKTERGKEIVGKVVEIRKGVVTFQSKDGKTTRLNMSIFSLKQQERMKKDLN